jgi:hydrogenase maturation protease
LHPAARLWESSGLYKDNRIKSVASEKARGQGKGSPVPHFPILVMGVGNIVLSDEGVGVRVIEAMRGLKLPDNVEILDVGTGALDIIDIIANREKVIIIDAVRGGGEPGAVYRFTPNDIAIQSPTPISVHQFDIPGTLNMAELAGCMPQQVIIFGIEPKRVEWGLELSPEVAAIIPRVIELIASEL